MCKLCMRQSLPASKSASSEARITPHRGAHTPHTRPHCPHDPRDNRFPCHQPPGRLHPRCATLTQPRRAHVTMSSHAINSSRTTSGSGNKQQISPTTDSQNISALLEASRRNLAYILDDHAQAVHEAILTCIQVGLIRGAEHSSTEAHTLLRLNLAVHLPHMTMDSHAINLQVSSTQGARP